jgi:hypothetical protein
MTRNTKILIFCLFIFLGAAFISYCFHFRPQIAAARQREETMKLAELEADLIRAAETGRGMFSQRHTLSPKPRPT